MSPVSLVEQLDQHRRKVGFDTFDIIVQQLISMVETGSIDVAPAYQRQFRWDETKRSLLIESVFLGVPVPSLFMASNKDGTWELVDGVQRLSTIVQFAGTDKARGKLNLTEKLKLTELEKLTSFNGLTFDELPESLKLQFFHRPIKVVTLSDKSDLVVRFDLFERLNTGGVALTNQEIRACIYRGEFNQFLEELSENNNFLKTVRLTKTQHQDGTVEELVLRFFAYLYNYKNFDHSVVDFLNEYMQEASKQFDYSAGRSLFEKTFKTLAEILPKGIVRTSTRNVTPINLFESVTVGCALAISKNKPINKKNPYKWIGSPELTDITTGATNSKTMVKKRIEYSFTKFASK
jgi:hypothetical protein